jgi:hypothetical protein
MRPIRVRRSAPLLLWLLFSAAASAEIFTRGPYLQMGTPQSVLVRWRTDVAVNGRVRYGTALGSLTSFEDEPAAGTEHVVALSGLSPDTNYYYSIGTPSSVLAGDDAAHFFRTSPPSGAAKPTRIWALGDSGTANSSARAVRDAYSAFAGSRHTDLWLMLGDNAYPDGTDAEYQSAVFDMYPATLATSVLWPTLGNHDGHTADSTSQTGPYYDIFSLPKAAEAGGLASGTEAYYSFDYGNIHFICLDSYESPRSPSGAMATWLAADIAATAQDWVIAFWHHPPYSKGSHDSDAEGDLAEMRGNVLPILEAGGVDLVLTGHSHSYERSFLLDGHYGTSGTLTPVMKKDAGSGRVGETGAYRKSLGTQPREGAVYLVAGSSGQTGGGALNHPAMFVSLNALGSLVIDVDGNRLDAAFLRSTGAIGDTFTITKLSPPAAADFHTVTPCRILDTRGAVGPSGGPALAANAERTIVLAGRCGIPSSARAVSVNLTVTEPSSPGHLVLFPAATPLPATSNLNFRARQTRANNAVLPLGASGDIVVRCTQAGGTVHFILDVNGYFE